MNSWEGGPGNKQEAVPKSPFLRPMLNVLIELPSYFPNSINPHFSLATPTPSTLSISMLQILKKGIPSGGFTACGRWSPGCGKTGLKSPSSASILEAKPMSWLINKAN